MDSPAPSLVSTCRQLVASPLQCRFPGPVQNHQPDSSESIFVTNSLGISEVLLDLFPIFLGSCLTCPLLTLRLLPVVSVLDAGEESAEEAKLRIQFIEKDHLMGRKSS